jgi:hypothetical protein
MRDALRLHSVYTDRVIRDLRMEIEKVGLEPQVKEIFPVL